ncbi:hypothetical protein BJ322DRAFT_1193974 [Thelephora terrestris]|uniref:BTB domain-containing protein n=1 Tax=Thelephora terrestris TaxID=56493 RepID=A0A9P6HEE5_9AGAM|nr:hypothetical protein BJ322DRAFT_1193974 [Thelephora terrestris]
MVVTTALCEALNQGISSGTFIDTKIILYSRRDPSGRVCRPKALYANSHVLKTIPYFGDLLFGDFAESQSKAFKDAIDEEEIAEDYGYVSDSDLEDDEEEKAPSAAEPGLHPFDPFVTTGEEKTTPEDFKERVQKGKVVKIPDMAFITFQAFLMYLYTDAITFAPFGSEENRRSRNAEMGDPSDVEIPQPSPKSIYRLADKYDVPALKRRALDCVNDQLANCDIVEESFSKFASQYDEIRNLYIERLAFDWMGDSTAEHTRARVKTKIKNFAKGDLEHATEMLSGLWEIANRDEGVGARSFSLSYPVESADDVYLAEGQYSPSVNEALIKSIRRGVFFDRMYWARKSKAGDMLKPIYFSSTTMDARTQLLKELVKSLKGRNPLTNDLGGNVNIESDCDCDGDVPEAEDESPSTREENEETRAVLITGSFSAWRSLFFYCYTGAILFAPLRSQGGDSRLNYIRQNTIATVPPPCSPKSIYVLANLLGIRPLCDKALADIKSKLTPENVVGEVFSWVAAGQKAIMEMQCDLLVSDFKDPMTIALVKENIKHISHGSFPHCAGALHLGLEKAFELQKKKRQPSCVSREISLAEFLDDDDDDDD